MKLQTASPPCHTTVAWKKPSKWPVLSGESSDGSCEQWGSMDRRAAISTRLMKETGLLAVSMFIIIAPALLSTLPPGLIWVNVTSNVLLGSLGWGFMTLPASRICDLTYLSERGALTCSAARLTTTKLPSGRRLVQGRSQVVHTDPSEYPSPSPPTSVIQTNQVPQANSKILPSGIHNFPSRY